MDGADVTAAPLGAWASIRGYFTPAALFLVVNIVIGTIALTSRSHQRRRRGYHHDDAHHPVRQEEYQYYQQQQQYAPPPAPLARTSSVLDRLRSIGLYRFRSGDFPPEYAAAAQHHSQDVISPVDDETKQSHYARSRSEPAPAREEKRAASRMKKSSSEVRKAEVARAPARAVEAAVVEEDVIDARADEFIDSFTPQQQELHYQEEYVPPPAPLARTPSVLDRLRSFGLYRFRSGDLAPEYAAAAAPTPAADATTAAADKKKQAAHYDRSRSEPGREQKEKKQAAAEARMTKSSSEARKATAAPSIVEEEGVDARADDFINKFRQQLQLQRLNSLLNYKEMLNGGGKQ